MSEETPEGRAQLSRPTWVAIVAAIALVACLGGFVGGSILISAGVSAYSGWAGVSVTQVVVTAATVSGPTYTPYPTYTLQPTYTPLPTYTLAPTPIPPTPTPMVVVVTPTAGPPSSAGPPGEAMIYTVQEGDTPQTIADQFGVDVVLLVAANELDSADAALEAGSRLTLPTRAGDLCLPPTFPVGGTVVEVLDGDSINVTIDGQPFGVEYLGIDAPELVGVPEPFGPQALSANQGLVDGQILTLVQDVTDTLATGQLPRYVLVGDLFVNYELVRQGYADAASIPPDIVCDELFALAAEQARSEGLGMWTAQGTPGAQSLTPTAQPAGTATPSAAPVVWAPPPTLKPTSTSSLGFNCNCRPSYVWGNFHSPGQGELCKAICGLSTQP